ncbi:putative quinol monooxygenase [Pseudomonas sp.]|uniref:putative quinol monooxygenase n=1 Tax=Pseudomonas sp. TaxID=306 RepID=UPI00260D6D42|nr:antibiotic biosynthesis monooxygenase family protein [Pseudomonas sp.]
MPQHTVVSHLTLVRARVGCSAQVHACLQPLIEPTLQTPGCLQFTVQHSQRDPLLWQVAGYWQDEPSMQAYFNSPLMEVFSVLVQQQVVDSLDFQTFNEAASSPLQMRAG